MSTDSTYIGTFGAGGVALLAALGKFLLHGCYFPKLAGPATFRPLKKAFELKAFPVGMLGRIAFEENPTLTVCPVRAHSTRKSSVALLGFLRRCPLKDSFFEHGCAATRMN